jgi:hypothetical protein
MADLLYIAILLACVATTGAFVQLCDQLSPRSAGGQEVNKP